MKRSKYVLCGTLAAMLAFLFVLSACDMGYSDEEIVNAAMPSITTQPQSAGTDVGKSVSFTVSAANPADAAGTLSYQWYQFLTFRAYDDQAGILINGATSASFSPPTDNEGEFNYYVVVTNTDSGANGRKISSVKSSSVTLMVNNPNNARYPIISQQPTDAEFTWSPSMALPTLEVIADVEPAEASEELRYQWYAADTLTNTQGTPIDGATTPRFIPPLLLEGQEPARGLISGAGDYYYFVVITNYKFDVSGRRESSVASSPVHIKIASNPDAAEPVIILHPQSAIYFNGDTVEVLTVEAEEPEDGGVLSYQWYSNTESSNTSGTAIENATESSYTPAVSTAEPKRHFYYVKVTNTNSFVDNPETAVSSRVAEVTVTTPASSTANATFTVQFGGEYQRQYVRGFGGMDVAWGNFPDYNEQDYENMFNPDILGYNIVRVMIMPSNTDINKTLDELITNQIYTTMDRSRFYENVKLVNRHGGYVLASPWSPPAAWKTNNSINGGGDLRESDYHNYANYLKAFANNMLNNGAPVYAISIQNEPNYTAGYDGCEWTQNQMRNFYRDMGHFTDGVAGFGGGKMLSSVRTMNGESANNPNINEAAMTNAASRAAIDLLGRHNYGNREVNGSAWIYRKTEPKEMWMTEHNLNSNSSITYPNDHTWNYIWLFMNDVDMSIRINHEAAFIWWSAKRFYSMIGDGTYGSADHEILPRGWGLSHFAKFAKESYRVEVDYSGATKDGVELDADNVNGTRTSNFESETVKVTAYMKLKGGEVFPVNWRDQNVNIADVEEISMVMFTPTAQAGSGGYDMGTVKLQMPAGFKIASATAMRSDPTIFNRSSTNRGTPQWETVAITADRNAAYVELPRSTILSVRFTQ